MTAYIRFRYSFTLPPFYFTIHVDLLRNKYAHI